MQDDGLTARSRPSRGLLSVEAGWRLVDRVVLRAPARALKSRGIGSLQLVLPSGEVTVLGRPGTGPQARLTVNRYRGLWKMLRGGSLGFAECFMDGDVDTNDLVSFFEFYAHNAAALTAALPSIEVTHRRDRFWHSERSNTRTGSRRNIAAHYDLGNDFYRLWLDPSMLYSSAIYPTPQATLDAAQHEKMKRIIDALAIDAEARVLEIGCGWGALAEAMARAGARVDAITISQQQFADVRQRIAEADLTGRIEVRFEDYRDTTGNYDRVVSVEMIEAVGEENWPLYFKTIAERLNPGGRAVIQAITINESAFARYRQNPDFIQRYIFPGGMLPTPSLLQQSATAAGLEFETVERFAQSYALTLREWRRRFEAAWPKIETLGFDDRFRRMWLYYLTYCEVGFAHGMIDVGLYRMRKPTK